MVQKLELYYSSTLGGLAVPRAAVAKRLKGILHRADEMWDNLGACARLSGRFSADPSTSQDPVAKSPVVRYRSYPRLLAVSE